MTETVSADLRIRARRTTIGPAEVEVAFLRDYARWVRLAYLVLPPALGRRRRTLAAHGVVQRALPDWRGLERPLAGSTSAADFIRRRVLQDAIRRATVRTALRSVLQAIAFRLFPHPVAGDELVLDRVVAAHSVQARAAWVLLRVERRPVNVVELELRAIGVRDPRAAITEATALDDAVGTGVHGPLEPAVFDPCSAPPNRTELVRRKARGRAVAVAVTAVLAVAVLTSLLTSAS